MSKRINSSIHLLEFFLLATLLFGWLQHPFEVRLEHVGSGILPFEHASAGRAQQIIAGWSVRHHHGVDVARAMLLLDYAFLLAYTGAILAGCSFAWLCFRARIAAGRPVQDGNQSANSRDNQVTDQPTNRRVFRRVVYLVLSVALGITAAAGLTAGLCDALENAILYHALSGAHVSAAVYARIKFDCIWPAAIITLIAVAATLLLRNGRRAWRDAHRGLGRILAGSGSAPRPIVLAPLTKSEPSPAAAAVGNAPPATVAKRSRVRRVQATLQTNPEGAIAICCSGGGIRSAAFNLGVLQAFMHRDRQLYQRASVISAVSGGSYIASAIALARAQSDGLTPDSPAFAPGSPEERHLRTHMHYLVPDKKVATIGLLALLFGLATNLGVVLAFCYVAARILGWFLHDWVTSVASFATKGASLHVVTPLWLTCVVVTSTGATAYVLGDKLLPYYTGQFPPPVKEALRSWAVRLLAVGAVGATLLIGVPGALVGLNDLALRNQPTTAGAVVFSSLGFTTNAGCRAAALHDFSVEQKAAMQDAGLQLTPPAAVVFDYGSCGQTFTARAPVDRPLAPPSSAFLRRHFHEHGGGPLAGLGATVLALLGLVKGATGRTTPHTPAGQDPSDPAAGKNTGVTTGGLTAKLTAVPAIVQRAVLPWIGTIVVGLLLVIFVLRITEDAMLGGVNFHQLWVVIAATGGLLLLPFLTDANRTSLHGMYRERLATVFAVRRTASGDAEPIPYNLPLNWSDLTEHVGSSDMAIAGPQLIVCATANVEDTGLVPPGRGGAPFAFSSTAIGIGATDLTLWRSSAAYEAAQNPINPGLLTVPGAVAVSGAAVSPVMGRMTRRPVRLLLGLANVRLGVWLINPNRVPEPPVGAPSWWERLWGRWRAPGVSCLVREMIGRNSIRRRYIYVTDGGHYDNLGLIEALRRQPRRIYVIDGSGDKPPYWTTVGHAISLARAELGVHILLNPDPEKPTNGVVNSNIVRGRVYYPDRTAGEIVIGKAVRTALPTYDVTVYANDDPAFPNKSTLDQLFGDIEFESYRQLGYLTGAQM